MLPSSVSKRSVYLQYMKAKGTLTYRLAPETTFYKIWRKYLPHVIITKPMTDLCWKCQHNSAAIVRSLNSAMQNQSTVSDCLMQSPELFQHKLSQVLERAKDHIDMVRRERNSFRSVLKETSHVLKQMFTSDDNFLPPLTWPITTIRYNSTLQL